MKIEKGKKYLCIKDVVMTGVSTPFYHKGTTYTEPGCIGWGTFLDTHFIEVFEWGEEVEISHDMIHWYPAIFIALDPIKPGYVYEHCVGDGRYNFGVAKYCRTREYKEITRQEIADKFEIPLDKLKIVD